MLAVCFLGSPVLLHLTATGMCYWHVLPFSSCFSVQIELHTRFVESKFTCFLIYFIVPQSTSQPLCFREASERRLNRMESQNGEILNASKRKLLRKSRCVQIAKFLTDVLLVMSTFN